MKRSVVALIDDYSGSQRVPAWPPGSRNDGYPKLCDGEDNCFNILDPERDIGFQYYRGLALNHSHYSALVPRAPRTSKFCDTKGTAGSFTAKNYPGTTSLANRGRQFAGVVKSGAKTAICLSLPLVQGARQLGTKYVTEHVMELQTPAQFASSMLKGVLRSGAQAPGAASGYNWGLVFGSNGYIFQTWSKLGASLPSGLQGKTPAEAIFYALGSTDDIGNLQILDAATNSLKAAVWQIFENIISDKRWNAAGAHGQVELLNRLYETLVSYLNNPDELGSLKHAYDAVYKVMSASHTIVPRVVLANHLVTATGSGSSLERRRSTPVLFCNRLEDLHVRFLFSTYSPSQPSSLVWVSLTSVAGNARQSARFCPWQACANDTILEIAGRSQCAGCSSCVDRAAEQAARCGDEGRRGL